MTTGRPLLLAADTEPAALDEMTRAAVRAGYDVALCTHPDEVLQLVAVRPPDLAIVDMQMPDADGIDLLCEIRRGAPGCELIATTATTSVSGAVDAIQAGAREYLRKPLDPDALQQTLVEIRELLGRRSRREPSTNGRRATEFCGMVGYGPAMQRVFTLIRRLAHHARVVLVEGETGTGKELVARALHEAGERRTAPFITINCSAVTGANFESELFGHEAGAFPGAVDMKRGLFEAAAGGTLFLDEVGELPLPAQARLLRVLESGEIQRLGTLEVIKVDVTIVAATSRDLHREVEAGRFRSDLFHRLTVTGVALPPLRERREDIPYLTAAFLREASRRFNKTVTGLSVGAEYLLQQSNWPGNVRELRNTIERAVLLTNESVISEREIWRAVGKAPDLLPVPPVPVSSPRPGARAGAGPGRQAPDDQERTLIVETLRRVRGNRMAAARLLGISRRSLYRRLERYQIVDAPQPVERHV